jgi:hypothetical protein
MKAIPRSLLVLTASVALAAAQDATDENTQRQQITGAKAGSTQVTADVTPAIVTPENDTTVFGPLAEPGKLLHWINPLSSAKLTYSQQPTQPRAFVDPVRHEAGLTLFRASLP